MVSVCLPLSRMFVPRTFRIPTIPAPQFDASGITNSSRTENNGLSGRGCLKCIVRKTSPMFAGGPEPSLYEATFATKKHLRGSMACVGNEVRSFSGPPVF